MIVCICHNVSERKIHQAVDAGMTSMPQLRNHLNIGTCCGKCHVHAKQVLHKCTAVSPGTGSSGAVMPLQLFPLDAIAA